MTEPRLTMTPELRAFAFAALREVEPDSHLVDCADAVVIPGDAVPDEPTADGSTWYTWLLAIQCGHGDTRTKITTRFMVSPTGNEEADHG